MTNTNILSLNSNQTYNRQWIETAHWSLCERY
jgi:hypothetical protein